MFSTSNFAVFNNSLGEILNFPIILLVPLFICSFQWLTAALKEAFSFAHKFLKSFRKAAPLTLSNKLGS